MKSEFVMTADETLEMKYKAKIVKMTGIPSNKLPQTTYELRVE